MTENMANATYRVFNFPHHTASYYGMYRAARNHDKLHCYRPWSWYLARAANTTIKFGAPSVGVMDDTVFREALPPTRHPNDTRTNPNEPEPQYLRTGPSQPP